MIRPNAKWSSGKLQTVKRAFCLSNTYALCQFSTTFAEQFAEFFHGIQTNSSLFPPRSSSVQCSLLDLNALTVRTLGNLVILTSLRLRSNKLNLTIDGHEDLLLSFEAFQTTEFLADMSI